MPDYKNSFRAPSYVEEEIFGEKGDKIGTIRIKPSGVLWKPKGQQKFYSVSLDDFSAWITNAKTAAKRIKQ